MLFPIYARVPVYMYMYSLGKHGHSRCRDSTIKPLASSQMQLTNHPINRSTNQLANQSTANLSIYQPIDQPINPSTNLSTTLHVPHRTRAKNVQPRETPTHPLRRLLHPTSPNRSMETRPPPRLGRLCPRTKLPSLRRLLRPRRPRAFYAGRSLERD